LKKKKKTLRVRRLRKNIRSDLREHEEKKDLLTVTDIWGILKEKERKAALIND